MNYAVGFDVSFRTGFAKLGIQDGKVVSYEGGTLPSSSSVAQRIELTRYQLGSSHQSDNIAVGIEQPIPTGNRLYMIEAAKRIGEVRSIACMCNVVNYIETHPSHMRGFVLNHRFKGKEEIEIFINAYLEGIKKYRLSGDEADAVVHALIVAMCLGWLTFMEPFRHGIVEKIRQRPQQKLT